MARNTGLLCAARVLAACGVVAGACTMPVRGEPVQMVLASNAHAATSPKSAVPGTVPGSGLPADLRFTNFGNVIYRSPTTKLWMVVATTNITTGASDQLLVIGSGLNISGGTVAAREGVTATTAGDVLNFSRVDSPRINDAGHWAMAFRPASPAGAADERLVKWDGTNLTTVFKGTDAIPALMGQTFGGSFTGATILNDDSVGFQATIAPTTGTANDHVFTASGYTLKINNGTDVPSGQVSMDMSPWSDITSKKFTQSADGAHWLALGKVGADTTKDAVVVVDGAVKIQKGSIITGSGFAAAVSTIADAFMESNGDWFARGNNSEASPNATYWVVKNGVVIAASGLPITPGSSEHWKPGVTTSPFRDMRGNNAGNYVVLGYGYQQPLSTI